MHKGIPCHRQERRKNRKLRKAWNVESLRLDARIFVSLGVGNFLNSNCRPLEVTEVWAAFPLRRKHWIGHLRDNKEATYLSKGREGYSRQREQLVQRPWNETLAYLSLKLKIPDERRKRYYPHLSKIITGTHWAVHHRGVQPDPTGMSWNKQVNWVYLLSRRALGQNSMSWSLQWKEKEMRRMHRASWKQREPPPPSMVRRPWKWRSMPCLTQTRTVRRPCVEKGENIPAKQVS